MRLIDNNVVRACFLFCLLGGSDCVGQSNNWHIASAAISKPLADENTLTLDVNGDQGTHRHLVAKSLITSIRTEYIYRNDAVVLGSAGNSDIVIVFDLTTAQRSPISFFCFQPTAIASRWIAFVEWYPNHVPVEEKDVVLVYDLLEPTHLNSRSGTSSDLYPFRFGNPVYPPDNAKTDAYTTVVSNPSDADHILGPPLVELPGNRVAFIAVQGTREKGSAKIVTVDLSAGGKDRTTYESLLPTHVPGHTVSAYDYLQATGIRVEPQKQLRIDVPKWLFGSNAVLVNDPFYVEK
jgi:hypothetical protein